MEVMVGHFSVFNQWTEIHEGGQTFVERIAPGAFTKTLASGQRMRVLLEHGKDPDLGNKPLGVPTVLREDGHGAAYEVPLFPSVPPLVVDGLRAGAFGSSFRFRVRRDSWQERPGASSYNPKGLPERTVLEAEVPEFGPVTFPAYKGATAGLRAAGTPPARFNPRIRALSEEEIERGALVDYLRRNPSVASRIRRRLEPPRRGRVLQESWRLT